MRNFALFVGVLALNACATGPGFEPPRVMQTCERHNAWVCATWTRTPAGYFAQFDQGTTADVTITRFDADSIILVRTDRPGRAPYTTAIYRGAPQGRTVQNGRVTWQQSGFTFDGVWNAHW